MLVDNKVPFRTVSQIRQTHEFWPNFPFEKCEQTPTFAFVLSPQFIVSNHRWTFLLNGLFLLTFHYILVVESSQRPTARGENRIDFACHFRFSFSLSRCIYERIEESMASVDVEHKALVEGTFYSCCMLRGHFPSLHYQPNFHESISFCVLILLTQNRWKNHDRSKYSTRQSRLARNDI